MNNSIINIQHLSHRYSGSWAIRDINIDITENGIVGLLGSNGAGKSTTMNILCGVLNQTEGNVFINGIDLRANPVEAKTQIGFLPQQAPLYMDLTVDEYLFYAASLRRIDNSQVKKAVDEVKERCGIAHFSSRLIKNLSGGYRQRVGIAQAIVHRPRIVVLDEPTNGLDPNQIIEVRALIKDIARDRLVIFSSHVLTEVQFLCRAIQMIENGRIVFADTMHAFNNYIEPHSLLVHFAQMPSESALHQIEGVSRTELLTERLVRIYFNGDQDVTANIVAASVQYGWDLREINMEKSSLEEVFKQLSQSVKS